MRLEEGEKWVIRSDGSNELGVRLFRSVIICMLFICYLYARSVVPSCMNLKKNNLPESVCPSLKRVQQ